MTLKFIQIPLLLLVVSYLELSIAQSTKTPLCNQCSCTSKQGQSEIDVDCKNRIMPYGVLYDEKNWLVGDNNNTYPIGSVDLKSTDIGDLRKKFVTSSLTTLDLTDNFIRNVMEECFSQLQSMQVLILNHNEIETLQPDVFKGIREDGENYPLKSLTTLKLANNKFHTLNQDLFKHIEQRLNVLDLSYNPFKYIDQQTLIALGSIIYLKELDLSFTKLKELPEHFMHTPKHLKVLDLSGNNFLTIPSTLNDSHVLEVLYFDNNPIANLTEENCFPTITTLKVLHMCDMIELENIEAKSMNGLENLEELHICNNIRLAKIDPGALTRIDVETEIWPPLKKIFIQNNELTNIDLHLVLHWEHLTDIDLRYNPWTCECENQWIIEDLLPIILKINETRAKEIRCEAPLEMKGKTFFEEYAENKTMRCLDYYGNRPERDATILVGVLVGLLIGIPLILFMIFAYQRHWFGLFDNSPASYSRQFYSRTRSEDL